MNTELTSTNGLLASLLWAAIVPAFPVLELQADYSIAYTWALEIGALVLIFVYHVLSPLSRLPSRSVTWGSE